MSTREKTDKLRITEIFYSLQGESSTVGLATVFIRLTGCPLRCQYCDTSYAFQGGEWMSLDEIIEKLENFNTKYLTVTGGEPLAQNNCLGLLTRLCDLDYCVSLETSGALDISGVDKRVTKIVDIKSPASGESDRINFDNLQYLLPHDEVKFVLCNREDYIWAKQVLLQHKITDRCAVLFSPAAGQLAASDLADWILEDQLPVRFQLQLHKILWGDVAGR